MNKRAKNAVVLSFVACTAGVSLYVAFVGRAPKIDLDTYSALGAGVAEETARLLSNQGRALVIARDTGADKIPSVEAELNAFQQTLRKQKGIRLVTERFHATSMAMMATGGGVPPDQLTKMLETHGDLQALVLFCGLPALDDSELEMLKTRKVKTVVVSSFRPDYAPLLKQRVIHLAIVPRPEGPAPGTPPARSWRERFDQEFVVLTAAEAALGR